MEKLQHRRTNSYNQDDNQDDSAKDDEKSVVKDMKKAKKRKMTLNPTIKSKFSKININSTQSKLLEGNSQVYENSEE